MLHVEEVEEYDDEEEHFQRAPTLGGECYYQCARIPPMSMLAFFQRAPTLGGECYKQVHYSPDPAIRESFNGHPPLGVNATVSSKHKGCASIQILSTGTHPWG